MANRYPTPWGRVIPTATPEHAFGPAIFAAILYTSTVGGFALAITIAMAGRTYAPATQGVGVAISIVAGLGLAFSGFEVTARTPDWRGSLAGHVLTNVGLGVVLMPAAARYDLPVAAGVATAVVLGGLIWSYVVRPPCAGKPVLEVVFAAVVTAGLVYSLTGDAGVALRWQETSLSGGVAAYVAFYWVRAFGLSRTADNAVDSACALLFDPVNRLLSLVGA